MDVDRAVRRIADEDGDVDRTFVPAGTMPEKRMVATSKLSQSGSSRLLPSFASTS